MSIYRSILFVLGVVLCLGAATSCSSDPPVQNEGAGTMSMPLQAITPSGNVYQLRSATFAVFQAGASTPTTTLTTSAFNDPTATLTTPLAAGAYNISLQTGWQLFRVIPANGSSTVVAATLVSPNPAAFSITSNQTTNVGFTFNVPGDGSVGFGGNLDVSINVNEVDGGSSGSFVLTAGISNVSGVAIPGTVTGPGIDCNGNATADCSQTFPTGTSVQLTAAPSAGLVFSGWSGLGCTDPAGQPLTTATITLTMTQPITCNATFTPQGLFNLTVTVTNTGGATGIVQGPGISCTSSGGGSECNENFPGGTSVVIDAAATGAGSVFTGWSGATCVDETGQTGPIRTVTMTQGRLCTANFGPATTPGFPPPPSNFPIVAWYSAEPQFITQNAAGQVSQWADRSGLGNHITQATATAQPIFSSTGWSASGQGAVVFNTGRYLSSGLALGTRVNGLPFSVLAVIRAASDSDGAVATFEQTGTAVAFQRMRISDGGPFLRFQANSDANVAAQNDESVFLSLTTGNVVTWTNTGSSFVLRTDGNAPDTAAHTLGALNTNVFRVGAALTGNSLSLDASVAELIVVSKAITATEYADFRTYARAKWAGLP